MLWFPQLMTGATVQLPVRKRLVQRTIVNESAEGQQVKLADPSAARVEWELNYTGLTDEERDALEGVFSAAEGRLGTFGFLDPFANLIEWSEGFGAPVWMKGPLAVTAGVADPLGGMAGVLIANAGPSEQAVRQAVPAPAWFHYCASVWARAAAEADVRVFAGSVEKQLRARPQWARVELPARLSGTAEAVEFGVWITSGTSVELFGFQVEAQVGASAYKRTTARSGVFLNASFVEDALMVTTDGLNNHSCKVRIRAALG